MSEHPLDRSRQIVERILLRGDLVLSSPANFGNGDTDSLTDMPLLLDEVDGTTLLPGTSIAGALRNYLREREYGFAKALDKEDKEERSLAVQLFGGIRMDPDGAQSALIVDDAHGTKPIIELRDGVAIDPATRTAAEHKKYDLQLLAAGTRLKLAFELLVPQEGEKLKPALALALDGLARGEISLGLRKRRGYGRCRVESWTKIDYDLLTTKGLMAWLRGDESEAKSYVSIVEALGVSLEGMADRREQFSIQAILCLDGSLLVRSGFGQSDRGPDMVQLHSRPVEGKAKPTLPGTSLAGAIRARCSRIARTLASNFDAAGREVQTLIEGIFGPEMKAGMKAEARRASRLVVRESLIEGGNSLVQSRTSIDRFTGGAAEAKLFNQQPLFDDGEACLEVELSLRRAVGQKEDDFKAEAGLLLLALKDLWTGDLTVGGEKSVGRGRLRGRSATLVHRNKKWQMHQDGDAIVFSAGERAELELYVKALRRRLLP